jgi:type IV pilus assembly protein PilB
MTARATVVKAGGRRLGHLLVAEGLISEQQLAKALAEQKHPEDLGSTLLRLRFIFEEQLVGFLSRQYGIPSIVLSRIEIDPDVLALVPVSVAKMYDVLPIKRHGTALTLAMADPTNVFAIDNVAFLTELQVTPVVASQAAIHKAMVRMYGAPPPAAPDVVATGSTTQTGGEVDEGPTSLTPLADDAASVASLPWLGGIGRPVNRRLGDLLVADGLITPDQLTKALEEQKGTTEKLGSILVRMGAIQEEQLIGFLSRQYGIPTITLSQLDLDSDVLRLLPSSVAKKYDVLPITRQGSSLTLAVADPTNLAALDEIAFLTNLQVTPVVASQAAIRGAIERNYEEKAAAITDLLTEIANEVSHLEVVEDDGQSKIDVIELEESADQAPVVRLVNMVLVDAIRKGASDVHWEPYEKIFRIRFRLDGVLHEMLAPAKRLEPAIISRLKIMSSLDIAERRLPQDGRIKLRYNTREIDFRVSILPTIFGEKAVLRILDKDALKLDLTELGFDSWSLEKFTHAIHQPYGMVLITGPTGSGKTTTLYSAIHTINKPDHNIMTAEDPVEYNLKGVNQVQVDEGVGRTFAAALRSFLRQDPDVILVGETRDLETAQISIRAALTGHLVFSTLHTNDCPSTIARLVDMGIPPFLISSALVLLLAQRLGRKVCQNCKQPYEIEEESLTAYGHVPTGLGKVEIFKGKGCQVCNFTGMKGRIAIYEVMPISEELREAILKGAPTAELREVAQAQGMKTLRQAGLQKVLEGTTTVDEVLRVTMS